jgi:predicted RNase H-like nuclease
MAFFQALEETGFSQQDRELALSDWYKIIEAILPRLNAGTLQCLQALMSVPLSL